MAHIALHLDQIIDGKALRRALTALTALSGGEGSSQPVRAAAVALLRETLEAGRVAA